MSRLSPLFFFILALFSAHVAFGAPSCSYGSNQVDNCVSRCRNRFGLSSTPSNGLPTPSVDANPYNSTTTTSSTYNPTPSGVPPSDGGNDQPSSSSPTPTPTPTPSPTPSTSSSGSGNVSADDIATWLSAHNSVRAQHGADPLSWSDDLSAKAQQWADGCVFQHSMGSLGPFGENLAAGTGGNYTITDAVGDWVSEAPQYDPNNPVASHFTQVVWKSTTTLGCAVAICNGIFPASYGTAQYYVCEYDPAGNVESEFPQNVQP